MIYRAHYESALHAQRMNHYLGIPTVILSAIVGTSVFSAIGQKPSVLAQIAVGLVSTAVTILAALQTFLRYSERAERHQATASGFAALQREARQILAGSADGDPIKLISSFRERWDELSRNAPTAFPACWKRAKERTDEETQAAAANANKT